MTIYVGLIHVRDLTQSHIDSVSSVQVFCGRVQYMFFVHMWDMTQSHVDSDSFVYRQSFVGGRDACVNPMCDITLTVTHLCLTQMSHVNVTCKSFVDVTLVSSPGVP